MILFSIYTVYGPNTSDFPGEYVCRRHEITDEAVPKELVGRSDSLEGLREQLPKGLHRIDRHEDDDRTIIECWI